MKLLIIEDDQILTTNFKKILLKEGFAVDHAATIEAGFIQLDVNEYDCIILDLGLPDGTGLELLAELRHNQNQTPVIIATARGAVTDRIEGLNLGADDYLPKPIDSNELLARIRAVIRRNSSRALPTITIGELTVTPAEHKALINNRPLELTAKEFAVLEYLAQHSGEVITRTMLMEHIWGNEFDSFSNVIDVYIRNLRRKLEKQTAQHLIRTIRGKGYILGINAP